MQVIGKDTFQPALLKVWSFTPVLLLFSVSFCLHPCLSSGEVQFLKSSFDLCKSSFDLWGLSVLCYLMELHKLENSLGL